VLPIRASYVTALAGLPALHKGPFDRALIAQAKAEGPLTSPLRDYSVQTILVLGGTRERSTFIPSLDDRGEETIPQVLEVPLEFLSFRSRRRANRRSNQVT
jgi:hypothetical protein